MRNVIIAASVVVLLTGNPSLVPAADRLEELERALETQKKTIEVLQQEIRALKQERARQQAMEQEVQGLKQAQQENQQLKREVDSLRSPRSRSSRQASTNGSPTSDRPMAISS